MVCLSVCLSFPFVNPAETAEPIEMHIGSWTDTPWAQGDGGPDPPREGQFWGLSGLLKRIVSHCCSIRSKKINKSISATAAADCIAPYWPISH